MVLDNHVPVQQKLHISLSSSYISSYIIPSEFSFHAYEKFRVSTYDVFKRWILKFYWIKAYNNNLNPLSIRKLKYEDTCSHSVGFCKSWKMNRMRCILFYHLSFDMIYNLLHDYEGDMKINSSRKIILPSGNMIFPGGITLHISLTIME